MKTLSLLGLLLLSLAASSQYTAQQLYSEFNKNSTEFENKYFNKRVSITGVIFSVAENKFFIEGYDKNHHAVHLTGTGYEIFITCQIPYEQKQKLAPLAKGANVTVTGIYSEKSGKGVILTDCEFTKAEAPTFEPPKPVAITIPANIPLGKYNVYQTSGGGFSYQYTMHLKNYTSYSVNGKTGNCTYDASTKVIRFTSGSINGFAGKYRPVNPTNKNDPPTIVIDHNGKVPNLEKVGNSYQYAYYQSEK